MKTIFSKLILFVCILAIAVPNGGAAAAASGAAPTPAVCVVSNARLEFSWARAVNLTEYLRHRYDHSEERIDWARQRIDRAQENGRDLSAVEAALEAYAAAVEQAGPFLSEAEAVILGHAGFSAEGKVEDCSTATGTLKSLYDSLDKVRDQVASPRLALRQALEAFRKAQRPAPTSVP